MTVEHATQEKPKVKTGTTGMTDLAIEAGRLWIEDQVNKLKRVRVPALTFTFPREVMRNYWGAFWDGRTLPFRFKVNDEVQKETFIGRLGFATTFIIADSVLLVGRFGTWILKKMVPGLEGWHVALVAIGAVGFLGWVFPWFLDQMQFMKEIEQTKTMQALSGINFEVPTVPDVGLSVGWLALVPLVGMIAAAPFSVVRFRKWRGFKSVLRKKSKPIIGDDEQ